jgi:hypothetical protein
MKANMGSTDKVIRILAALLIAVLYFTNLISGITATILLSTITATIIMPN